MLARPFELLFASPKPFKANWHLIAAIALNLVLWSAFIGAAVFLAQHWPTGGVG